MVHRMEVMNFMSYFITDILKQIRVNHMITLLVFIDINKNEGKLIIQ